MQDTNKNQPKIVRRGRRLMPGPLMVGVLVIGIFVGMAWPGEPQAATRDPDIVVRVNDDAITVAELHRAKVDLVAMRRLVDRSAEELGATAVEREALESLIERQLLLQEARRRDLSVSDNEVDAAISELRRRFQDLESFGVWMQERGLNDEFLMVAIRADILTRRVTELLTTKARVTEPQVAEYYAMHKDDLSIGEQVRLAIIAVESFTESEEILTVLQAGKPFDRLVRERSIAPGGDTGWVDPQTLPLPLQQAIASLEEGEVTGPITKGENEYLIVGMAGRRSVRATTLRQATPEIERRLLPLAKQQALTRWFEEAKGAARIVRYSDSE